MEEKTPAEVKTPNRRAPIILAAFITGIVILGTAFFISNQNKPTKLEKEFTATNSVSRNDSALRVEIVDIPVLIDYVPGFDDLEIQNLPTINNMRGVYPYGKNLIVHGINNLLEYDPENKKVVRTTDLTRFDCLNHSAKIENFLYTACNASPQVTKQAIYKIDLKSGHAVKRYAPGFQTDFTNVDLSVSGTTLFAGLQNGVVVLDTVSDHGSFFTPQSLGFDGMCPWYNVDANEKFAWAIPQASDCKMGIAVYDKTTKTWQTYFESAFRPFLRKTRFEPGTFAYSPTTFYITNTFGIGNVEDYIVAFDGENKTWKKVVDANEVKLENPNDYRDRFLPDAVVNNDNVNPPDTFYYFDDQKKPKRFNWTKFYYAVSKKVNGKYYLISDGIETLEKNGFPKPFLQTDITNGRTVGTVFVDQSETYLLYSGRTPAMGEGDLGQPPVITLLTLKTKEQTDLLASYRPTENLSKEKQEKLYYIVSADYLATTNGVIAKKQGSQEELFRVDFQNKKLILP